MLRILPVGERPSLSTALSRISACRHREVSENGRVCANDVVRRRLRRIDENNIALVVENVVEGKSRHDKKCNDFGPVPFSAYSS